MPWLRLVGLEDVVESLVGRRPRRRCREGAVVVLRDSVEGCLVLVERVAELNDVVFLCHLFLGAHRFNDGGVILALFGGLVVLGLSDLQKCLCPQSTHSATLLLCIDDLAPFLRSFAHHPHDLRNFGQVVHVAAFGAIGSGCGHLLYVSSDKKSFP
ncbi:hypothetical protein HDK64DRAFT_283800, partial [Phyllosticta capitalensis]